MWIFGQVWFACLVGFAVGVLLDWAIRVRPLGKRVAELEDRMASDARAARAEGEVGRSVFDRGAFSPANMDADGFVTQRNRGGLLTPSRQPERSLGTELINMGAEQTEVRTGAEDFPGVARLSSSWEADAEEATRNAPEPWHPVPSQETERTAERMPDAWAPDAERTPDSWQEKAFEPERESAPDEWTPITIGSQRPADDSASWRTQLNPPVEPPPPSDAEADRQYLEFLRAGAAHAPTDESLDADDIDDADYRPDAYDTRADNGDFPVDMHGEVPDDVPETAAEVTTVLPFPLAEQTEADDETPRVEGYEAYESYADSYQRNGYESNGYDSGTSAHYEEYQYYTEDVEEPEESTPLPRRGSSSEMSQRFSAFELPYAPQAEAEPAEVTPGYGEITPIEDGGWQPFQKPAEVDAGDGYESYQHYLPDDGEYAGAAAPGGAHALLGQEDDEGSPSWFDHPEGERAAEPAAGTSALTHRMLPVSRPDLDHPDLLEQSVFGGDDSPVYAEDERPRSLFEPVIQPDAVEDDYRTSDYRDGDYHDDYREPAYSSAPVDHAPQMAHQNETTDEFFAPRPIRVRTGVDGPITQSIPAIPPVPEPPHVANEAVQQGTGNVAPGPFGPGSALPLPDGSAPAPEFRIKARTSSMVFHTESSPFYERLEPQVWFRDQEDAKRAGFTSWERPRTW